MHEQTTDASLRRWRNITVRVAYLGGYTELGLQDAPPVKEGGLSRMKVGEHLLIALTRAWATRPNYELRSRVFARVANLTPSVPAPCAVVHVRHSDIKYHKRIQFSLDDHVKAANSANSGNQLASFASVLLMTDSMAVQEQAKQKNPGRGEGGEGEEIIKWATINRARFGNSSVLNSHLPSGDAGDEVVWLLSELAVAARCQQITHSRSALSALIWEGMCNRMGWKECLGKGKWGHVRKAVCDGACCSNGQEGQYDVVKQRCKGDTVSLPFPCLATPVCSLLGT